MPHPCSHWAVWTFGKVDPSRRTFDSVTDITDEYRAELASEEAKLGRPDLPKLVYERGEIDSTKKTEKVGSQGYQGHRGSARVQCVCAGWRGDGERRCMGAGELRGRQGGGPDNGKGS